MVGHRCLIVHWSNPKTCVNVKNDPLKMIKVALGLSRHHVHTLMFEVGFYFWSLTITKLIIKEALNYLGHQCLIIHWSNPLNMCQRQKWSIEDDQSGIEIISTSCTHFDVRSRFLFSVFPTTKPIIKEALNYLDTGVPPYGSYVAIKYTCPN